MSDSEADRREGYKYCWKCYEKAHGFIPDQWNPWVRGKCESCGLSTECFRSPTEWEKKNVYEHLQTDHAGLPAFVAELEALGAKATPGPWIADFNDLHSDSVWIAEFQSGFDDLDYTVALRNHGPALLALVRQLQGKRDRLDALLVKAAGFIDLQSDTPGYKNKLELMNVIRDEWSKP